MAEQLDPRIVQLRNGVAQMNVAAVRDFLGEVLPLVQLNQTYVAEHDGEEFDQLNLLEHALEEPEMPVVILRMLVSMGATLSQQVTTLTYNGLILKMFRQTTPEKIGIILLSGRVNIDSTTHQGQSLLHLAVLQADIELVHHVLCCGPDINLQDNSGNTPLHTAATLLADQGLQLEKRVLLGQVVRTLLEKGAKTNLLNSSFQTPIQIYTNFLNDFIPVQNGVH